LIKQGDAYVDDQSIEDIRKTRGTLKEPGINSPYRNRTVEENLKLFENMKIGKYKEGERVLRAKIDMSSGNINLRDPVLYRIMHKIHPKTQNKWVIYPMYDYAHGQSDSIEKITHSICTLEFETHRPLYDWFQEKLKIFKTRQIEFARLNVTYMVMSKRKLLTLVNEKWVNDWDDPRMPTISGMRRRGYTKEAIKDFCNKVGVAKRENMIPFELLELCVREDMDKKAIRLFAIVKPLKIIITNYDQTLENSDFYDIIALNHPKNKEMGQRKIKFEKEIYIDQDDFQEKPEENFHRLAPNRTVRLRYAFCITCNEVIKDENTKQIIELRCTYDPTTKSSHVSMDNVSNHTGPTGPTENIQKVKATIHWMGKNNSHVSEFRMYDKLFTKPNPESDGDDNIDMEMLTEQNVLNTPIDVKKEKMNNNVSIQMNNNIKSNVNTKVVDALDELDKKNEEEEEEEGGDDNSSKIGWRKFINKDSLIIYKGLVENYSKQFNVGDPIQFERVGFFTKDKDSTLTLPVFNLTVALVDNFALQKKKNELKQKELDKLKREKIANERRLKKEEKKKKELAKLNQDKKPCAD
ncbi:glutamine--tRNA ligase, putative, partial [Hepatocystis sp. ex Piliocolobus tephrosceles]